MLKNINFVKQYLNSNETTKLNLGCGNFPLDGWLNTDKFPIKKFVGRFCFEEYFHSKNHQISLIYSQNDRIVGVSGSGLCISSGIRAHVHDHDSEYRR